VSGNFMVYESYEDPTQTVPTVYAYHIVKASALAAGQTQPPPYIVGAAPASSPDVDGTNVVYIGFDPGTNANQIFVYDDVAHASTMLTHAVSKKDGVRISGSHVVWSDDRNGTGYDLYGYDLSTGIEDRIAGGPNDQSLAGIDGSRVAFTSVDANNNPGVYVFTYATPSSKPIAPVVCNDDQSVLVDGPYSLTYSGGRFPVSFSRPNSFTTQAGYVYYVCITNGLSDGTLQATNGTVTVDGKAQVSTSDFAPDASGNPPPRIATQISFPNSNTTHSWGATLPVQPSVAYINVSIRSSLGAVSSSK
jgi:beta propeller repeat protein